MPRTPLQFCSQGHLMSGDNLLWHKRYDEHGQLVMARECRTCSNKRYRNKRGAKKRNRELEHEALSGASRVA